MKEKSQLKLVILYDGRENQYTIRDHNLTAEIAAEEVNKWKAEGLPALTINQRRRHSAADAETCRACRNEVNRSSGLVPTPQFKRRNS